jgi:uncharacterized protein YggE
MHQAFAAILFASVMLFASMTHAADYPQPRTVTTGGQATIRTVPDEASLSMAVEIREPALETARDKAAGVIEAFLADARKLGIEDKAIATLGARVQPDYEWIRDTGERRLRGYVVTREIRVNLDDLELLGPLVEKATAAGVNQIQPAMLTSSRREELERQALSEATRDARRRAEAAAAALDARVGTVRTIDAAPQRVEPVPREAMLMAADARSGANGGWQPGEITIPARVTVTFDLEP